MTKLLTATAGAVLGVATWLLLFVILGTGLGTAFIAAGVVLAGGMVAAGMIAINDRGAILDAPLTSAGLVAGIAAFAVLEIVLSVPMWIDVVTGLGVMGLFDMARGILSTGTPRREAEPATHQPRPAGPAETNGHDRYRREPLVGAG